MSLKVIDVQSDTSLEELSEIIKNNSNMELRISGSVSNNRLDGSCYIKFPNDATEYQTAYTIETSVGFYFSNPTYKLSRRGMLLIEESEEVCFILGVVQAPNIDCLADVSCAMSDESGGYVWLFLGKIGSKIFNLSFYRNPVYEMFNIPIHVAASSGTTINKPNITLLPAYIMPEYHVYIDGTKNISPKSYIRFPKMYVNYERYFMPGQKYTDQNGNKFMAIGGYLLYKMD